MKNRSGSYKKILIDLETLESNGPFLRTNLENLKKQNLSPHHFTTLYLLLFLRIKHPKNWIQQKSKKIIKEPSKLLNEESLLSIIPESFLLNEWEKEKLKGVTSYSLFTQFNLKAIPESINRTLIQWMLGNWSIEMLEHIPNSRELLKLQVKNTRCITVITNLKKIDSLILNSRDPLSFLLHDLMHADQFFSQEISQKGQLGFYKLIDAIYDKPELLILLKNNEEFKKEFEYVASDMNAYVIHLFKCLKSSIYRTEISDVLFKKIYSWWNMNTDEISAANRLNTPEFSSLDEFNLKEFFEKNQEIFL